MPVARIDVFLRLVNEQRASDLHFHAGTTPKIRINGDLLPLNFRELTIYETKGFLYEILTPKQQQEFEQSQGLDFMYELPGVCRFRANAFYQYNGIGAVFRVIPDKLPTPDDLLLPTSVRKLVQQNNGLVLVTGPTGSGKTTTLAALVNEINRTAKKHIITIEDPIEFIHEPISSVVTQRQVGTNVESFAAALRSALREAPDVIVIGELRDCETITLAMSAAETGILVLGTLHTNSAGKAISRIIDIVPDKIQDQTRITLSVLLRGVLAQRLCKKASGDTRIAALEILIQNYGISNMIRENKLHQLDGYLQSVNFEETGMQSMDSCLLRYIKEGLIWLDDALKIADYPEQLRSIAKDLVEEQA
jgi:twitching motility protein PilT